MTTTKSIKWTDPTRVKNLHKSTKWTDPKKGIKILVHKVDGPHMGQKLTQVHKVDGPHEGLRF